MKKGCAPQIKKIKTIEPEEARERRRISRVVESRKLNMSGARNHGYWDCQIRCSWDLRSISQRQRALPAIARPIRRAVWDKNQRWDRPWVIHRPWYPECGNIWGYAISGYSQGTKSRVGKREVLSYIVLSYIVVVAVFTAAQHRVLWRSCIAWYTSFVAGRPEKIIRGVGRDRQRQVQGFRQQEIIVL
jgi:hypothetical protein